MSYLENCSSNGWQCRECGCDDAHARAWIVACRATGPRRTCAAPVRGASHRQRAALRVRREGFWHSAGTRDWPGLGACSAAQAGPSAYEV